MRRRSSTLYADNIEDYVSMANSPASYLPLNAYKSKSARPTSLEMEVEEESGSDNFWDDFDYKDQPKGNSLEMKFTDSLDERRYSDAETDCTDSSVFSPKKDLTPQMINRRYMVLGTKNAETYKLINSGFVDENYNSQDNGLNQATDLIVRKDENEGLHYHFWLKNVEDNKYDFLVKKVYYKSASVFVFVYNPADRESFVKIEEAIQEAQREVPSNKFFGILLANCTEENYQEVETSEALRLRERYDLMAFYETREGDYELKEKLTNTFMANML